MTGLTTFEDFESRLKAGFLIPVQKSFLADTETPVSVFSKIRNHCDYPFLFESVEGGEQVARFSFIGFESALNFSATGKDWEIKFHDEKFRQLRIPETSLSPLEALKQLLDELPINQSGFEGRLLAGAIGYIGYDTIRLVEDLPEMPANDSHKKDIDLDFYTGLITFDNLKHTVSISVSPFVQNEDDAPAVYTAAIARIKIIQELLKKPLQLPELQTADTLAWKSNLERTEFENNVSRAREFIAAGDIFQVVLSQRFNVPYDGDPFNIYRMLRILNPSPYLYYLEKDDVQIIGSSPEMLVRIDHGIVETRPIAGTRKRGTTTAEDNALADELIHDEKERAEHIMLVDLGRNDIGQVAEFGSVKLPELMQIERYSHVMHIVSQVQGKLKTGLHPVDAFYSCFPAGTVSGAPKIRAMEIIDQFETVKRGIYAGAVGYFDFTGNMDWCIAIRTIVVHNKVAYIQAGAGIVADSDPEKEFNETVNKAAAMKLAVEHEISQ